MAFVVQPQPMKENSSLSDYIEYFGRVVSANSWSDENAALYFASLLPVGNRMLDSVSEANMQKFTLMKASLITSAEPFRESNLDKLLNIRLYKEETLNQFRDRISKLVNQVYPKFAKSNKAQLVRDFFVIHLPGDLKKFVIASKSDKIDEALNSALLGQSLRFQRSSEDGPHRRHSNQTVQPSTHARTRSPPNFKFECYKCSQTGHIARFCPNAPRSQISSLEHDTSRKFVKLSILGKSELALVDTGASVSLLPYGRFKATWKPLSDLVLLSGDHLPNFGGITADVHSDRGHLLTVQQEFIVSQVPHVVIGIDMLRKMNCCIDLVNNVIIMKEGFEIPMQDEIKSHPEEELPLAEFDEACMLHIDSIEESNFSQKLDELSFIAEETVTPFQEAGLFDGIGRTKLVQHHIPTSDNNPICLPSYRIPMHLRKKAENCLATCYEME